MLTKLPVGWVAHVASGPHNGDNDSRVVNVLQGHDMCLEKSKLDYFVESQTNFLQQLLDPRIFHLDVEHWPGCQLVH